MVENRREKISGKNTMMTAGLRCRSCGKALNFSGYRLTPEKEDRICSDCYQHLLYPDTGNGQGPMSD